MSLLDPNQPWSEAEEIERFGANDEPIRISQAGLDLIKEFEGYHKRQPDGSCVAYLCPARVPTIGYGCTKGVRLGMRWTHDEAENGLRRELDECERAVIRYVTVPINQNQFDALVSFTYNCGVGALRRSTLLKKLNAKDYDGAEAQFQRWTRGGGRVLRGLVRRRKREAELFGRDMTPASEDMPQAVSEDSSGVKTLAKGASAVVAGGAAVEGAQAIPATTWESGMIMVGKMGSFAAANWQTVAAIGGVTAALMILPRFFKGAEE